MHNQFPGRGQVREPVGDHSGDSLNWSPLAVRTAAQPLVEGLDVAVFENARGLETRKLFDSAVASYKDAVISSAGRLGGEQPAEAYGWMLVYDHNPSTGKDTINYVSPLAVMYLIKYANRPCTIDDLTAALSDRVKYSGDAGNLKKYVVSQVASIVNEAYGNGNTPLRERLRLRYTNAGTPTIAYRP